MKLGQYYLRYWELEVDEERGKYWDDWDDEEAWVEDEEEAQGEEAKAAAFPQGEDLEDLLEDLPEGELPF